MFRKLAGAAIVAAIAFIHGDPAAAAGPGGFARGLMATAAVSYVASNKAAPTPRGERVPFCGSNADDCFGADRVTVISLDSEHYKQLRTVSRSVNRTIRPIGDERAFEGYFWLAGLATDADNAAEKRARLVAMGWPQEAMRIESGDDGRSVLVISTTLGKLALGQDSDRVKRWKTAEIG